MELSICCTAYKSHLNPHQEFAHTGATVFNLRNKCLSLPPWLLAFASVWSADLSQMALNHLVRGISFKWEAPCMRTISIALLLTPSHPSCAQMVASVRLPFIIHNWNKQCYLHVYKLTACIHWTRQPHLFQIAPANILSRSLVNACS